MGRGGYVEEDYERDTEYVTDRVTADGAGPGEWPVEPGRYRLVVARACPWANRAIIVRRLLGLEDVLSMGVCGPTHDADSWTFDLDPGGVDPVLGIPRLKDAYEARVPGYERGITVPALVEVESGRLVTNDFPRMTLDLSHPVARAPPSRCPGPVPAAAARRDGPGDGAGLHRGQQRGVPLRLRRAPGLRTRPRTSGCGAAWTGSRSASRPVGTSWATTLTEADVRLFTTLARFDAVYHGHFKCNRQKLAEMPVLWAYARDLFQTPGFGDTVDFAHVKAHYYVVHSDINPTGVIPAGPDLAGWASPHGRESLGGLAVRRGHAPRAAAARASASTRRTTPTSGRRARARLTSGVTVAGPGRAVRSSSVRPPGLPRVVSDGRR